MSVKFRSKKRISYITASEFSAVLYQEPIEILFNTSPEELP